MASRASKSSQPLINAIIDRLPIRAVNCTTFTTTKVIAGDVAHPLNIKIRRKLAAFDPQGFYWRVNCPQEISKKAVVRNTCKGDFKKAFEWALAEAGWDKDGKPLDSNGTQERLTGAVLLSISKDPTRVLTAKKEDLRRDAGDVVKKLAARQDKPTFRSSPRAWERPPRNTREPEKGQWKHPQKPSVLESPNASSYTRYTPT